MIETTLHLRRRWPSSIGIPARQTPISATSLVVWWPYLSQYMGGIKQKRLP